MHLLRLLLQIYSNIPSVGICLSKNKFQQMIVQDNTYLFVNLVLGRTRIAVQF